MPKGSEKIMLVEDDPAVRAVTARALSRLGYTVREARDGQEALALLSTDAVQPALLVTDIIMPGMNGVELAQRLREKNRHSRVLFISGYSGDALANHGFELDAEQYLQKPFSVPSLATRVRAILDGVR